MATHSSILAWRIPGTKEPHWLQSIRSQTQTGMKWRSMRVCMHRTHTISLVKNQSFPDLKFPKLHMFSRFKSNTVFSITSWAPLSFLKLTISPSNILNIYTMDRGARWATVHSTAESDMTEQLRTHAHTHSPFEGASCFMLYCLSLIFPSRSWEGTVLS